MRLVRISAVVIVLGIPAIAWAQGGASGSQGGAGAGGAGASSGANPGAAGVAGRRQPTAKSVPASSEKDSVQQLQDKRDREMEAATFGICSNCGVKR